MSDYDVDVLAWSERQGSLLRRLATGERVNDADLDWPNIAEEIESVGCSERSALSSHIAVIIEHLIKLETSRRSSQGLVGVKSSCAHAARSNACWKTVRACGRGSKGLSRAKSRARDAWLPLR